MKPQMYSGKTAGLLSALSILALCFAVQAAPAQRAPNSAPVKAVDGGWGEAKEGLRIGLLLQNPGREFHYGDILTFALRAWNVGEKDFECTLHALPGNSTLTLTGNRLWLEGGFSSLTPFHLVPWEVADLPGGTIKVRLVPVGEKAPPGMAGENAMVLPLLPGKYTLEYLRPLWISNPDTPNSATIHPARPNPITFTVLPDRGAQPIQTPLLAVRQPDVLWGDTVNGIQSGISYAPEDRTAAKPLRRLVFQHWVRNITDRPIDVTYALLGDYEWNGSVTDAKGNSMTVFSPLDMMTGLRALRMATLILKPGEPLVLQKSTLLLVPEGKKPAANDYTQRMTAPPGVYDIFLSDLVGHAGLHMDCVTPKLKFTLER